MRAVAIHDGRGGLAALTSVQAEAPLASVAPEPGLTFTELEIAEDALDLATVESEAATAEALGSFRVDVRMEAKLVERDSEDSS
jgi:hypothetical protein